MDKVYYSQLSSRYIYLTNKRRAVFKVLDALWRLIECPEFDTYPEHRKEALRANFDAFDKRHEMLCEACAKLYRLSKSYSHWC